MDKLYKIVTCFLLAVIAGFLLLDKGCSKSKNRENSIDTLYIKSTDHYHNIPVPAPYPVPYKVEIPGAPGSTVTIPAEVDSGAVVRDYFTKRHYNDSIVNDSISIYIKEDVYRNELKRISVGYRWKAPTMVIEKTQVKEKQLLFIGAEPYGNLNQFGLFGSLIFDTKRAAYGYGYDPFNKMHKFSVYGKIKLWKK